jgi:hypothetical protein
MAIEYHQIFAGDSCDSLLLHRDAKELGRVVVRDRYADLVCSRCGKLDEYTAALRGLDDDASLRTRRDVIKSFEGLDCFSERVRGLLEDNHVRGLEFIPIPRSRGYSVAVPLVIVPLEHASCNMKFHGEPCPLCGRYRETSGGSPYIPRRVVPEDPMTIFSTSLRPEKGNTRRSVLIAHQVLEDILRKKKISGVDWESGAWVGD